jgi:WD40 repeat protein
MFDNHTPHKVAASLRRSPKQKAINRIPSYTYQVDDAQQASIRLATELAEDGNFVDANLVASHFLRSRTSNTSIERTFAKKLISRDVSTFTAASGDKIIAVQRMAGQLKPFIVSRSKIGRIKTSSIPVPNATVDSLQMAADGNSLTFSSGKRLTIVKTSNQEIIHTDGHDTTIRLIAISDDGSVVASFGDDSLVRIWDGQTGTPLTSIQLRDVGIPYLSISPSGAIICVAVGNGPAKYINLKGEAEPHALRPRGTHPNSICPLPDGRAFVVGCQDGTTRIMELKMGRESAILEGDGSPVTHVTASPDGRRLLAQTRAGRISIYESANAERTHIWQLSPSARDVLAVFTSNDYVAIPRNQTTVDTIALNEVDIWTSIPMPKVEISDAILCNDDKVLLCGDTSGRLTKVSTSTGNVSETVQCHRRRIQNIRIHPTNKKQITMASWDTTASIFDIGSLEPVMMFTGHADRVRDAMLSTDGRTMVTVADDRTCRFWNAKTGKLIHVSTLQERPVAIEACSNDDAVVIDQSASRITLKRGVTKPVSIQKQRFDTKITAVRTVGNHTMYLAGSKVIVTSERDKVTSNLMSSDRITACHRNAANRMMCVGTNTGHVQIWCASTMTELIDAKCSTCELSVVGFSQAADFLFAVGVDGRAKYIRFSEAKQ